MILVNCDIGERGPEHPVDIELMNHIQIANIACGGHAGDPRSVSVFRNLAEKNSVMVAAHLSYPDRENFGRISLNIGHEDLWNSLAAQMQFLPGVHTVKFHGALYNDSVANGELATLLAKWANAQGIDTIITPRDSEMAKACDASRIPVMTEAFAERRYTIDNNTGRLRLVGREKDYACIHSVEEAMEQVRKIVRQGSVQAILEMEDGQALIRDANIAADTICIHSDSEIALPLARGLSADLRD